MTASGRSKTGFSSGEENVTYKTPDYTARGNMASGMLEVENILRRQRQAGLCEFEVNLVYIVNSRPARAA